MLKIVPIRSRRPCAVRRCHNLIAWNAASVWCPHTNRCIQFKGKLYRPVIQSVMKSLANVCSEENKLAVHKRSKTERQRSGKKARHENRISVILCRDTRSIADKPEHTAPTPYACPSSLRSCSSSERQWQPLSSYSIGASSLLVSFSVLSSFSRYFWSKLFYLVTDYSLLLLLLMSSSNGDVTYSVGMNSDENDKISGTTKRCWKSLRISSNSQT